MIASFLFGSVLTFTITVMSLSNKTVESTVSPITTITIEPTMSQATVYLTPSIITQPTKSFIEQSRIQCEDNSDCAGSPCENGFCNGFGEGADCIEGLAKVCNAQGICDCVQQ